jgi:hypothetical protein
VLGIDCSNSKERKLVDKSVGDTEEMVARRLRRRTSDGGRATERKAMVGEFKFDRALWTRVGLLLLS